MNYEQKYLKYKQKYLNLKRQFGFGNMMSKPIAGPAPVSNFKIPRTIKINFRTYKLSLTNMIKELTTVSNNIYNYVISQKKKTNTYLICVGQTPGYYALSMLNLPQYNERNVKIIILPYSTNTKPTDLQERSYARRLRENGINFTDKDQLIILDQAQHGYVIGNFIYILQNRGFKTPDAIILLNSGKRFLKDFIKTSEFLEEIPIINHFTSYSLARFSDSFPRIVQHYRPDQFETIPMNINFINIETNPFVQMIIDCSRIYPNDDSEWYRLNDFIPEYEIEAEAEAKAKAKAKAEAEAERKRDIITLADGRLKCNICGSISGTIISEHTHRFGCKYK